MNFEFVGKFLNFAGLDSSRFRDRIKAQILPQQGRIQQCFRVFSRMPASQW
jgi:hypothetical protein